MEQEISNSAANCPKGSDVYGKSIRPVIRECGIALSLVVAVLLLTLLIQPLFSHPFLFFFFASVMASAWFGGATSGVVAVCISTIAVDYYLVPPFHSLKINASEETYFAAFVVCALGTSLVASFTKKNEAALKGTCKQLQLRVGDRTLELEKMKSEVARLEAEIGELSEKLETRKLIDRAKGILQQRHKISENEAYLMIQSQSRKRNKPMKEIAEAILLKNEIVGS